MSGTQSWIRGLNLLGQSSRWIEMIRLKSSCTSSSLVSLSTISRLRCAEDTRCTSSQIPTARTEVMSPLSRGAPSHANLPNAGHFEKLIFLGSDVSSAAPRAEFNGTELHVYVARRQPSKPIRSSSPLPPPTDSSSNPIVTHSTGPPERAKVRILTGPEGAKAAAKAAREEATLRAKEAAKVLPKVGSRKAPFAQLLRPPERSGTITQRSHSSEAVATTEEEEEEQPTSPARPKFRPTDLTLRAGEATFLEAAKEEEGKGEGGRTPRGENAGMRFSMEIGTAL